MNKGLADALLKYKKDTNALILLSRQLEDASEENNPIPPSGSRWIAYECQASDCRGGSNVEECKSVPSWTKLSRGCRDNEDNDHCVHTDKTEHIMTAVSSAYPDETAAEYPPVEMDSWMDFDDYLYSKCDPWHGYSAIPCMWNEKINNWDCWTNDHSFIWLKIPGVPAEGNVNLVFKGLFENEQKNEDLLVFVDGHQDDEGNSIYHREWRESNENDGVHEFIVGPLHLNEGDNFIGLTHPLYKQEMSDGENDDYSGGSIHFIGKFKISYTDNDEAPQAFIGADPLTQTVGRDIKFMINGSDDNRIDSIQLMYDGNVIETRTCSVEDNIFDPDDNKFHCAKNFYHTQQAAGQYTYTGKVTDNTNQEASADVVVHFVDDIPVVRIEVDESDVLIGDDIVLTVNGTDDVEIRGVAVYRWIDDSIGGLLHECSFGDGIFSSETNDDCENICRLNDAGKGMICEFTRTENENGSYTYAAVAYDSSEQESLKSTVTVNFGSVTPPTIDIKGVVCSRAAGCADDAGEIISCNDIHPGDYVNITIEGKDNEGLESVSLQDENGNVLSDIDGNPASMECADSNICGASFVLTQDTDGNYCYYANAKDNTGLNPDNIPSTCIDFEFLGPSLLIYNDPNSTLEGDCFSINVLAKDGDCKGLSQISLEEDPQDPETILDESTIDCQGSPEYENSWKAFGIAGPHRYTAHVTDTNGLSYKDHIDVSISPEQCPSVNIYFVSSDYTLDENGVYHVPYGGKFSIGMDAQDLERGLKDIGITETVSGDGRSRNIENAERYATMTWDDMEFEPGTYYFVANASDIRGFYDCETGEFTETDSCTSSSGSIEVVVGNPQPLQILLTIDNKMPYVSEEISANLGAVSNAGLVSIGLIGVDDLVLDEQIQASGRRDISSKHVSFAPYVNEYPCLFDSVSIDGRGTIPSINVNMGDTRGCPSTIYLQIDAKAIKSFVKTFRNFSFTPASKVDGDYECNLYWPDSHWCSISELENVTLNHNNVLYKDHKQDSLGQKQFIFNDKGYDGCYGKNYICPIEDFNTSECVSGYCSDGETLICCYDDIHMNYEKKGIWAKTTNKGLTWIVTGLTDQETLKAFDGKVLNATEAAIYKRIRPGAVWGVDSLYPNFELLDIGAAEGSFEVSSGNLPRTDLYLISNGAENLYHTEMTFNDNVLFKLKRISLDAAFSGKSAVDASSKISFSQSDENTYYAIIDGEDECNSVAFSSTQDSEAEISVVCPSNMRCEKKICYYSENGYGRELIKSSPKITIDKRATHEICNNGIDDDGDKHIDYCDTDCSCPAGTERITCTRCEPVSRPYTKLYLGTDEYLYSRSFTADQTFTIKRLERPSESFSGNSRIETDKISFSLSGSSTYYKVISANENCPSSGYSYTSSETIDVDIACREGSLCEKRICYYATDGNYKEDTHRSPKITIDKRASQNNAPLGFNLLYPLNNAGNIDKNGITLEWESSTDPDGDSVVYDIYFGTSVNPPLVRSGLSSTTYSTGSLLEGRRYYWTVWAKDSYGKRKQANNKKMSFVVGSRNGPPSGNVPSTSLFLLENGGYVEYDRVRTFNYEPTFMIKRISSDAQASGVGSHVETKKVFMSSGGRTYYRIVNPEVSCSDINGFEVSYKNEINLKVSCTSEQCEKKICYYSENSDGREDVKSSPKIIIRIDEKAPIVLRAAPSGVVKKNTINMMLLTDEACECRYGVRDRLFNDMSVMDITGKRGHMKTLSLNNAGSQRFYIRCKDENGNEMDKPFVLNFYFDDGERDSFEKECNGRSACRNIWKMRSRNPIDVEIIGKATDIEGYTVFTLPESVSFATEPSVSLYSYPSTVYEGEDATVVAVVPPEDMIRRRYRYPLAVIVGKLEDGNFIELAKNVCDNPKKICKAKADIRESGHGEYRYVAKVVDVNGRGDTDELNLNVLENPPPSVLLNIDPSNTFVDERSQIEITAEDSSRGVSTIRVIAISSDGERKELEAKDCGGVTRCVKRWSFTSHEANKWLIEARASDTFGKTSKKFGIIYFNKHVVPRVILRAVPKRVLAGKHVKLMTAAIVRKGKIMAIDIEGTNDVNADTAQIHFDCDDDTHCRKTSMGGCLCQNDFSYDIPSNWSFRAKASTEDGFYSYSDYENVTFYQGRGLVLTINADPTIVESDGSSKITVRGVSAEGIDSLWYIESIIKNPVFDIDKDLFKMPSNWNFEDGITHVQRQGDIVITANGPNNDPYKDFWYDVRLNTKNKRLLAVRYKIVQKRGNARLSLNIDRDDGNILDLKMPDDIGWHTYLLDLDSAKGSDACQSGTCESDIVNRIGFFIYAPDDGDDIS
ncbi:MAG: hypothetical protein GXO64_04255, partial [Candidatus Micrarchaeota archaeon]|nr:hypothetical protein [Candidatus Micrarchaeota archaeon]